MSTEPLHATIQPATPGKSDFFSWNLYRFVKQHPRHTRVYLMQRLSDSAPRIYLGLPDDEGALLGNGLNEILRSYKKFPLWMIMLPQQAVDITDAFWAYYKQNGACTLDEVFYHDWQDHADGMQHCRHCGARSTSADGRQRKEALLTSMLSHVQHLHAKDVA